MLEIVNKSKFSREISGGKVSVAKIFVGNFLHIPPSLGVRASDVRHHDQNHDQTDDRHHDHRPEFRLYVNKMTDTTITDEHHRPMTRHHDPLTDR